MNNMRWVTGRWESDTRMSQAHITLAVSPIGEHIRTACGLDMWSPLIVDQTRTHGEINHCSDCRRFERDHRNEPVTPTPIDPHVSIQHRCPQMREHVRASWRGTGAPGSDPDDLPVPCPDCFSLVVTSIRIPWQPRRDFTITEGTAP